MQVYKVGGTVRDKLLNIAQIDSDWVVIGSSASQMLALGFMQVGKDFPVFLHPRTKEEYALARTERKTGTGYVGFSFAITKVSLKQDLLRRDLTINALAMDYSGKIIDYYGGLQDLKNKKLRHVSSAFSEDPLRLIRVAVFYARFAYLGFTVAPETQILLNQIVSQGELTHIARPRIVSEILKGLASHCPNKFVDLLLDCNALHILFGLPLLKNSTAIKLQYLNFAKVNYKNADLRFCALCLDLFDFSGSNSQNSQQLKTTLLNLGYAKNLINLLNNTLFIKALSTNNPTNKLNTEEVVAGLSNGNRLIDNDNLLAVINIATSNFTKTEQAQKQQIIGTAFLNFKNLRPTQNATNIAEDMQNKKFALATELLQKF